MIKSRILVIGATGMLGHECYTFLNSVQEFEVFGTSRLKDSRFFLVSTKDELAEVLAKSRFDYLINCIGTIKPNIDESNEASVRNAIWTNSLFPYEIVELAAIHGSRVIQIATDCVFSGQSGSYVESSIHDASDVYGRTKSLGEVRSDRVLNLRCSIIGLELGRKTSLLEWFLSRPALSEVNGFTNHSWNGITTYHFARLASAIIKTDSFKGGTFHITPGNALDKYSLLKIFQSVFSRKDLVIIPTEAKQVINRTLSTIYPEFNKNLWEFLGFPTPPNIEDLVINYYDYLKLRDHTSQKL